METNSNSMHIIAPLSRKKSIIKSLSNITKFMTNDFLCIAYRRKGIYDTYPTIFKKCQIILQLRNCVYTTIKISYKNILVSIYLKTYIGMKYSSVVAKFKKKV